MAMITNAIINDHATHSGQEGAVTPCGQRHTLGPMHRPPTQPLTHEAADTHDAVYGNINLLRSDICLCCRVILSTPQIILLPN